MATCAGRRSCHRRYVPNLLSLLHQAMEDDGSKVDDAAMEALAEAITEFFLIARQSGEGKCTSTRN